jgi:hypothetical protein
VEGDRPVYVPGDKEEHARQKPDHAQEHNQGHLVERGLWAKW